MTSAWRKSLFLIVLFLLLGLAVFLVWFNLLSVAKAGAEHDLSGYAWSDNIGWISFNSSNDHDYNTAGIQPSSINYGVDVAASGAMSGYAWSPNIGWISFNESTGCPSVVSNLTCPPIFNKQTGVVSGWALALAGKNRTDGWDGWISLKGLSPDYGVVAVGSAWQGWAWGGVVVGWISFSGITGKGDAVQVSTTECSDGIDNDGDVVQDASDPGCWIDPQNASTYDPTLNSEANATTQCQDGLDNDSDGKTDYPDDPGCLSVTDNDEFNQTQILLPECNDGADNDGDGKFDYPDDPGCSSATDNSETTQCNDGLDNDNDGFKDIDDSGCHTDGDATNISSYDPNIDKERRVKIIETNPE